MWQKHQTFSQSLRGASAGLYTAWLREKNVRRQVMLFMATLLAAWLLQVSFLEAAVLITVSGLVIGLELVNSAMEGFHDVVQPQYHEAVRHSKDMAAAAVLLASGAALIVGILLLAPPLWALVRQALAAVQ